MAKRLSDTSAIAAKPIRPEPGMMHLAKTRQNPLPPMHLPGNFGRQASPDTGESFREAFRSTVKE